jgi:predicted dehydrogenase
MAKTRKVGIIGVAGIARTHFPGWEASPHAELAALADVDGKILEQRGQEQGIDRLYEDPEDLIKDPDIDIIDICTPNVYHAPLAVAALKEGKHVLCEKPLAPSPKDIDKMIAARDKSGKLLMTAQHFRYHDSAQALKSLIDQGALGNVYHARSWMLRRSGAPTRPGFIQKAHSGGGPCIDIGVHILDLTLWMMGHPKPVTVSGVTQNRLSKLKDAFSDWGGAIPKSWDVEEFAAAMIRFENGGTLILEVSWLLNHDTESEDMQMWLYGDKGGAHWPKNELLTTDNRLKRHMNMTVKTRGGMEPHAAECVDFAEAVAKGRPSPVPPEESRDVQVILEALYKSARKGGEVRIGK